MEEEYPSERDEETPVREGTSVPERRRHAFPAEIVAVLRAYHQKGMVGTGRDYSTSIKKWKPSTSITTMEPGTISQYN